MRAWIRACITPRCLFICTYCTHLCVSAIQTSARTSACLHVWSVCSQALVRVGVCKVCVCARTVATSITQSRELQSVKSTLTFMVLTSQGHPKAEHLEWSVTFQTENNSRVFCGLWRRLFILPLTLIHFDLARGNNGLNTLIFLPLLCTRCLSFACRLPLAVSLFSQKNVPVMTWSLDIKQKERVRNLYSPDCRAVRTLICQAMFCPKFWKDTYHFCLS